jgi:hypothetical protein
MAYLTEKCFAFAKKIYVGCYVDCVGSVGEVEKACEKMMSRKQYRFRLSKCVDSRPKQIYEFMIRTGCDREAL